MDANNRMPARDAEGYLVEPTEWDEDVAAHLARELDIDLEDDHWDVIRYMRTLYDDRRVAPDARHIIKHLEERYPGAGRKRLFELFPYGYPAQACKIAGMKRPRAWSTG
ncbi:MAG: TusE/DsrC/DsvC family sulfur relay protein [Sterolibacteriaceae bacterium MAG5]|nr:TusE/DsrC/DsvC family sulfur relay protein [Candidatus Nitricoxidireducens bremensis]